MGTVTLQATGSRPSRRSLAVLGPKNGPRKLSRIPQALHRVPVYRNVAYRWDPVRTPGGIMVADSAGGAYNRPVQHLQGSLYARTRFGQEAGGDAIDDP
jgi:hypothetical protein